METERTRLVPQRHGAVGGYAERRPREACMKSSKCSVLVAQIDFFFQNVPLAPGDFFADRLSEGNEQYNLEPREAAWVAGAMV